MKLLHVVHVMVMVTHNKKKKILTKKLYQAVITFTHPQTVIMNVEGDTSEEARDFVTQYLSGKLESFEILELEEISNVPEELEEAESAQIFQLPGNDSIH